MAAVVVAVATAIAGRISLAGRRFAACEAPAAPAAFLLLAAAVGALAACSEKPTTVSQAQLLDQLRSASPPIVLDVRTAGEYATGHVPGAILVPENELAARLPQLSLAPDREIVVYCERGRRSAKALETLHAAGYARARHLEGDMGAWRSAGLPCDGCSGPSPAPQEPGAPAAP